MLRLRFASLTVFAAALLLPALAFALPPVFLPAVTSISNVAPGGGNLHARFSVGGGGSFDPDQLPTASLMGSGGGEIQLSKAVRLSIDGHGGAGAWLGPTPGELETLAEETGTSLEVLSALGAPPNPTSRYFAGGHVGVRIVTPTGVPELGFGAGGGVIGYHEFDEDGPASQSDEDVIAYWSGGSPGEPMDAYVSGEFELMGSGKITGGFVSVASRFGPTFELRMPRTDTGMIEVLPALVASAELSVAIGLANNTWLTVGPSVMIGHDFGATSETAKNGSAVGSGGFSIGIFGTPVKK